MWTYRRASACRRVVPLWVCPCENPRAGVGLGLRRRMLLQLGRALDGVSGACARVLSSNRNNRSIVRSLVANPSHYHSSATDDKAKVTIKL